MIIGLTVFLGVSQVVVYPDRAQVTRTAQVVCGARAGVAFGEIPPAADPATFRARTSVGTVEGLRAEARTREEAFAPELKGIDAAIRKFEAEATVLRDARTRGQGAAHTALQYSNVAVSLVSREMSDAAPNTKAWGQAFDATLAARLKASSEAIEVGAKLRDLSYRIADLGRQRGRLTAASARHDFFAEVLVTCPDGKRADVELTYLVGGASWQPAYEARADEAGGAVELAAFATVSQSTGEDWAKAKVILSTAVPRQDATPPELKKLSVWAQEHVKERKVLVRREERTEHAEATGESGVKLGGDGRMAVASQGLSVQLAIPEPSDVAGDGTPARLFIARTRMKAQFAYRAAPRLMPFVFRVADLANSAPFPLLAGPLDAFRRGGLTGRYALARTAEGQRFHLTFGIEEALRVKRVVVEEVQRDAGIFGTSRRFRYGYRYELANYLGRPETIELSDQLPVSELDDVKVSVDVTGPADRLKTTPGFENRPDDGIVSWKLALKAGEKRNVDLAFHVDVPASYDGGGL